MRAAVRPLLFISVLYSFTAVTHSRLQADHDSGSDADSTIGGGNYLGWSKNSPTPTVGGVDVSAVTRLGPGFTCTSIVVRVIDSTTLATLDTITINNPGSPATASFTGLGSNRAVQVRVDATFQDGNQFETLQITAPITTR